MLVCFGATALIGAERTFGGHRSVLVVVESSFTEGVEKVPAFAAIVALLLLSQTLSDRYSNGSRGSERGLAAQSETPCHVQDGWTRIGSSPVKRPIDSTSSQ
jgi:hypothetical protein